MCRVGICVMRQFRRMKQIIKQLLDSLGREARILLRGVLWGVLVLISGMRDRREVTQTKKTLVCFMITSPAITVSGPRTWAQRTWKPAPVGSRWWWPRCRVAVLAIGGHPSGPRGQVMAPWWSPICVRGWTATWGQRVVPSKSPSHARQGNGAVGRGKQNNGYDSCRMGGWSLADDESQGFASCHWEQERRRGLVLSALGHLDGGDLLCGRDNEALESLRCFWTDRSSRPAPEDHLKSS